MKKILITGINGFAGSHLADYVLENGLAEVHGTYRGKSTDFSNISGIRDKVTLHECDLTDYYSVSKAVKDVEPDFVSHLAAQSFVPTSWRAPQETLNTNVIGSLNLFEAIRLAGLNPVIQIACSSEEYGLVLEGELPIREENPLRPLSPYGVSKVSMDLLGYQYFKSYGMKIVRTRAFNHTGPRRGSVFVSSDWTKQVAEIEAGKKQPVIEVGNLESSKDFTYVRDVVKAYWLALQKAEHGEVYNICSEKAFKMRDVLNKILSFTGKKIKVRQDPKRMRPSDVEVLLGNCSKFREKTGWKPKIPFDKTLKDLFEYWRERV